VGESDKRREEDWFKANEKDLIEAARLAREKREQQRTQSEQEEERRRLKDLHFMKCPKCGHDLAEEGLDGVRVDRCSFCEGIFFDAGELEQVLLKKESERSGFFRRLMGL
jgi:hypothetical protein